MVNVMPASLDPYALSEQSAASIAMVSGIPTHDVAVILGTGLAGAAAALGGQPSRHDLGTVAGLPGAFVPHQRSEVWSIDVGSLRVLAFLGRLHLYEGYSAIEVAHLVRTAVATGCRTVVITNASGAIDPELTPGDVVLISDHLNLTGVSPLTGIPTSEGRPSPFVDLVAAWSPRLRALAHRADGHLAEGVYAQVPGPHFETPAEIRMLRAMGADLVGMSSVLEAIAARQLGAEVLGLSLVTNMAAGLTPVGVSPASIIGVAEARAADIGRIIRTVVLAL
jgi:purine-nucleoside phosphorylase